MFKIFEDIQIVCVCPTRNEQWVIGEFCKNALRWADNIIIYDQSSIDKTRAIAEQFDDVEVYINKSEVFNEAQRQIDLLELARSAKKPYASGLLIVALDADEMLSPCFPTDNERAIISNSRVGTTFSFEWHLVSSDRMFSVPVGHTVFGYLDDGRRHSPKQIHSPRLPSDDGSLVALPDTRNWHLQLLNNRRQRLKQIWYQALEVCENRLNPIVSYRKYRSYQPEQLMLFSKLSGADYRFLSKLVFDVDSQPWWQEDLRKWSRHEKASFGFVDLLDEEYGDISSLFDVPQSQSMFQKAVIAWLRYSHRSRQRLLVRCIDKCLRLYFCLLGFNDRQDKEFSNDAV